MSYCAKFYIIRCRVVETLRYKKDVDFVVIANKDKENKAHETLMHYIDLCTPRPIVPTADYSKIITPHMMAINYIHYIMYAEMYEITQDLNEEI